MEEEVSQEYIKGFNLGYEVAKELNLETPLFRNEDKNAYHPIQAGILEFINENKLNKKKTKDKFKGRDKGLSI